MRLLLVMFIHITNANLATLSLFAEKGDKVVAKSTERIRVSLEARIPLTQSELLKSILAAQIVGQEWGNLTAFEGVTPFSTQFKMALEPGLATINEMKVLATRLYSYTAASEYVTPSNCTLNFTLVEGGHFEQGVKHIITARAGLSIVGVPADLMANKDLLRKISDFSLSYNGLARDWKGDLDLALPILNNLAQGTFPDSLRGKLEVLPCLSAQGSNFEKIEVRSCAARNRQYTCELTVAEPILVSTYTELLPLLYEASSLKIEEGAYLIRDKVTNKIGTLKCKGTDPITSLQLCRLETGILPPLPILLCFLRLRSMPSRLCCALLSCCCRRLLRCISRCCRLGSCRRLCLLGCLPLLLLRLQPALAGHHDFIQRLPAPRLSLRLDQHCKVGAGGKHGRIDGS